MAISASSTDLPAPVGPTIRVWPTSPTCSEKRNGVDPSVLAKNSGGASKCSSRSGPAQTADSGIICARRSEEHTSELQSLMRISYAVFCLKKKKNPPNKQQQLLHSLSH